MVISPPFLLRNGNVSDKSSRENENIFYVQEFLPKMLPFMEQFGENIKPYKPQKTISRMRVTCRIPKATNTLSEYLIPIAFPLQQ